MVGGGGMWTAGDLWCAVLWFVLFEEVNVNSRLHQTAQTIKQHKVDGWCFMVCAV